MFASTRTFFIQEALREPPVLEWLHSSAQKLTAPTEIQVDSGVLPSLTAALLSPPVRPNRVKCQVKRAQSEFHSSDYLDDLNSSLTVVRFCHSYSSYVC